MANELDKFVLQYIVEQREAIARLEALNKKVEETGKKSGKAKEGLKEFASGAADEIGKLIPGIDKAGIAIRALGTGFAAAAVAVAGLAAGVNSVIALRERFNRQRKEGMDIGISELRLEEYQRKFVRQSGGTVTREQTAENLQKISEFTSAIARDPTRVGAEARAARVLGLQVGQPGESIDVNAFVQQLGARFATQSEAQVQAAAKTLGIGQDFALSLRKQGAGVGEITELSMDELEKRNAAQTELNKFNDAMAKLKENFDQARIVLGEKLLPPFTKFVEKMAELSKKLPEAVDEGSNIVSNAFLETITLGFAGQLGLIDREQQKREAAEKDNKKTAEKNKSSSMTQAEAAKASEEQSKKLKAMVDGNKDRNAEAKRLADQQALSINQFAGAVASFANAVDEKQAWAAWAGEVGRAAGLGSTPREDTSVPGPSITPVAKATGYDELFKKAGTRFGIDPSLLKNIAKVESNFNPRAMSKVGASGLMQIMQSNFKSLGITDPFDPEQNIMGGAKLFAEHLKRAKGDVRQALTTYHGGFDKSAHGKLTAAYPGKVLGAGQAVGESAGAARPVSINTSILSGEDRAKINLRSVQNTIAARLGVPVGQLQLGGINRGDVEFASSQLIGGIRNQIFDITNQLKAVNLPQQTRAKLMNELREQQSGLMLMRKFSGQVEATAQPGERSITVGERAVVINVNGADDPNATAATIQAHLSDHIGEIVNGTSNGMVR